MRRDEAIARLKALEPELRARGVAALYLFGSTARDEARPDSDLDVFIDFAPGRTMGLEYFGLSSELSERLRVKVDAMSRRSLHPLIRADVEREAVRVF